MSSAGAERVAPAPSGLDELVALSERMGYLQALRVAFAVVVLASATFASSVVGASLSDLLPMTAGYMLLSAAAEGLRRLGRGRGLSVIGGMLLADGVYLAWIMYASAGIQTPIRFLVYVHIIGVTLLASYRTGLKITLWHSLLFFVVYYAQAAEILEIKEEIPGLLPGSGPEFQQISMFYVTAYWIVAVGTAAFSALNERELRRGKDELGSLAAMAAGLENADSPESVAESLLRSLAATFGFRRGAVLGASAGDPALLAYIGPGEVTPIPDGIDPIVREAWDSRTVLLKKQLDPEQDRRLAALLPFARNLIIIPLIAEGTPIGVVALEHPNESGRIERQTVTMLGQFTTHAGLALRNAWLLGQVQQMADTDALTGIANRRMFEQTLERELSRAIRTGDRVTLMILDVDHFKKYNDKHGHQAGDEALRGVADKIAQTCRDFDTPARYGGEEFAVILPSCTSRDSLAAGDRIRKALTALDLEAPITASAGVATFPTHAADSDALVQAADEALYESKRAGRDRVTRSRRRASRKPSVSARASD